MARGMLLYGAVVERPETKDPSRRRLLAGGIALAAAALLVACTALVGSPGSLSGRSDVLRPDELAEIENRAKFCGVYDDPVQCLKDHIASQHRYWTSREVREELFKTMKGLAELEMRAGEKHGEKGEAAREQEELLKRLRARLHAELKQIKSVQEKLAHKHATGMEGISGELVKAARDVKEMTDKGVEGLKTKMQSIQDEQDGKDKLILAEIDAQIQNVSTAMHQVHEKGMSETAEVQQLVEAVQLEMDDANKRILRQIDQEKSKAAKMSEEQERTYGEMGRLEDRQSREENDDFVEELPGRLREGSQLILSNLTMGLDDLERLIGGMLRPGILAVGKDVDSLSAVQRSDVAGADAKFAGVVSSNKASDAEIGAGISKVKREQQEASFTAQRRAAELAQRIVEIGEDAVTAQQVLSTAQKDLDESVASGLKSGEATIERVRKAAVADVTKGVTELSGRLAAAQEQLRASKASIGEKQSADVVRLTQFVGQAISQLNASLATAMGDASAQAQAKLEAGEAAQGVKTAALGGELRGQSKGMKKVIAGAHTEVSAREALERKQMSKLGEEDRAAGQTTQALAAALQRAIADTKARLDAAKLQVLAERKANEVSMSKVIKSGASQLANAVAATSAKDEADVERDVSELLEDVESRLGGVDREARKSSGDLVAEVAAANRSDHAATEGQQRELDAAHDGSRADAHETDTRIAGLRGELSAAVSGLAEAMSAAEKKRGEDEEGEKGSVLASVQALSSKLFARLSETDSAMSTKVAGDLQRSLELIAEVGESIKKLKASMTANSEAAEAGEAKEDATSAGKNAEMKAEAEQLKNEAASEIEKLHAMLESAYQHLAVVRQEASAERAASTKAIGDVVDGRFRHLETNVTDLLALQSRELGAVISGNVQELSGRLDAAERRADAQQAMVQGKINAMTARQERDDEEERNAMESVTGLVKSTGDAATSRGSELYRQVVETQKTLTDTEASLRKLLDDHWIALTDKVRASLTAGKSLLLGTLGNDRDQARLRFAGDVVKINGALSRLSNDTAADDVAMQTLLGEAAGQEVASHAAVRSALARVDAEQRRHKEELDGLFQRLNGELEATNAAVAALKKDAGARQSGDLREVGGRISGEIGDAKAGLETSQQVDENELRGKLAGDSEMITKKLAELKAQLSNEESGISARLSKISRVANADDATAQGQISRLFKDGRATRSETRAYYTKLSGAISAAQARLAAAMHKLDAKRGEDYASLKARIEAAASSLHELQVRVSTKSGLSLTALKSTLSILDTDTSAARQELKAKVELSKQTMATELQDGLASAKADEKAALHTAAEATAADLASQVKASSDEVTSLAEDEAKDMAGVRERLGAMSKANAEASSTERARIGQLEGMNKAQALYSSSDAERLQGEIKGDLARLSKLREEMHDEVGDDLKALKGSLTGVVGSAKAKLLSDLKEAVSAAKGRAQDGASQFRQQASLVQAGAEERAGELVKELEGLAEREARDAKHVGSQTQAQVGRIEGLANTTRDGVDAINDELDGLFKRMDDEHEALHAGDSSEKEAITKHVEAVMGGAQANLTNVVGEASGSLGEYMSKVISGADAGLSEAVERLEAMGDNLNSTIKQDGSELLQLIDVSRMNVSFVASRLDSAVDALTRRVKAIQDSRDAVDEAQQSGHAKSTRDADDLKRRIEADEVETKETAKLTGRIRKVLASLKAVKEAEAQKFQTTLAGLKEASSKADTIQTAIADGLKTASGKVADEDKRRKLAFTQTSALLSKLLRDIRELNNRVGRASKPKGDKGPTGPPGEVGIQGAVGARGQQGIRGARGPLGKPGVVGMPGIEGLQGTTGSRGEQGPRGGPGEVGPVGLQGIRGPTGPKGAQGTAGEVGEQGPAGRPGRDGRAGIKGRKGEQGQEGAEGEIGLQGPAGPPGAAAVMPTPAPDFSGGKICYGMKGSKCRKQRQYCMNNTACGCIPLTCSCGEWDCIKAGGKAPKKQVQNKAKKSKKGGLRGLGKRLRGLGKRLRKK